VLIVVLAAVTAAEYWFGGASVRVRTAVKLSLALLVLLALSGCFFRTTADELYYLPRASDEFIKLQTRIDGVRATGAEYAPPTGGENRQSVQLVDIDGDGVKEAVAFFRVAADDNPIKIYIFRVVGDDYEVADIIQGAGTGIESIRYIDMDADGTTELLVGWQMGAALRHMTLYSMRGFNHISIAETDYTTLTVTDLTGDGCPDVAATRLGTSEVPGEVALFTLMTDGEVVRYSANITDGIESISRIAAGKLRGASYALFLDGKLTGGGIITDVFCFSGGALNNITRVATGEELVSRPINVFATDINGDGITEVPRTIALPQQSETIYYAIEWYAFRSNGSATLVQSTYHNYSDSWYLVLPESWLGRLTVRREDFVSGERTIVFSYADPVRPDIVLDFMKIFTLSGDNREERARLSGRFTLQRDGDKIYAAQLIETNSGLITPLTQEEVALAFKRIYTEWITGG